jgi:hypothetical protein
VRAVHCSHDNGETWELRESQIMPPDIGIENVTISNLSYVHTTSHETTSHIYRSLQPTCDAGNLQTGEHGAMVTSYPTPFSDHVTIRYRISGNPNLAEPGRIAIYNLLGQLVDITEGANGVATWRPEDCRPGIYFCKFEHEGKQETRRVILID